jgi:voltage-gated potassium channel Kch
VKATPVDADAAAPVLAVLAVLPGLPPHAAASRTRPAAAMMAMTRGCGFMVASVPAADRESITRRE